MLDFKEGEDTTFRLKNHEQKFANFFPYSAGLYVALSVRVVIVRTNEIDDFPVLVQYA